METASIAMATATDPRVESEKSGADRWSSTGYLYSGTRLDFELYYDCDAVIWIRIDLGSDNRSI